MISGTRKAANKSSKFSGNFFKTVGKIFQQDIICFSFYTGLILVEFCEKAWWKTSSLPLLVHPCAFCFSFLRPTCRSCFLIAAASGAAPLQLHWGPLPSWSSPLQTSNCYLLADVRAAKSRYSFYSTAIIKQAITEWMYYSTSYRAPATSPHFILYCTFQYYWLNIIYFNFVFHILNFYILCLLTMLQKLYVLTYLYLLQCPIELQIGISYIFTQEWDKENITKKLEFLIGSQTIWQSHH